MDKTLLIKVIAKSDNCYAGWHTLLWFATGVAPSPAVVEYLKLSPYQRAKRWRLWQGKL